MNVVKAIYRNLQVSKAFPVIHAGADLLS